MAATPLTTSSYLPDPIRVAGLGAAFKHAAKWISRGILQITRAMPEVTLALVFVVWVGAGPLAGILAIAVHNAGVLGRLYSDVLEEVEPGPPAALQAMGVGTLGTFLFGVLPQVRARLAAFTLYRFEVNVRATAMVGFVGAGGIGDALHTAISLFHLQDLALLLLTMVVLVTVVDTIGDRIRAAILRSDHGHQAQRTLPEATEAHVTKLPAKVSFPLAYGGALVAIERIVEVAHDRLIVETAQEVPEDQCLTLAPVNGTARAGGTVTVTAHRAVTSPTGVFVYELRPCSPVEDTSKWLPMQEQTAWHLQTQPDAPVWRPKFQT